ncbi:hypothetical protein OROMI_033404 [Orobanche minor]
MESLPDAVVQHILSLISNAKDLASCECVSKRWKDSTPYLRSLFFPHNVFDNPNNNSTSNAVVTRMVSQIVKLEELVVYCPFSIFELASWLSISGPSLKKLELRMDNLIGHENLTEIPSKLDYIRVATNLESLELRGVLMVQSPKWDVFHRLKNLEIVGSSMKDCALSDVLCACPNLTHLLLLGCEGLGSVSIDNARIEQCKLDFYGAGNCSLMVNSPKIASLEVQGCSVIRVFETICLKHLSISNNSAIQSGFDILDSQTRKGRHYRKIATEC